MRDLERSETRRDGDKRAEKLLLRAQVTLRPDTRYRVSQSEARLRSCDQWGASIEWQDALYLIDRAKRGERSKRERDDSLDKYYHLIEERRRSPPGAEQRKVSRERPGFLSSCYGD